MDLTTLSGDDTEERVRRLCAKRASRCPTRSNRPGDQDLPSSRAVCVYHLLWRLRGARSRNNIRSRPFPPASRGSECD